MYARILVPVDGSDSGARGLAEAIALARATGATLHLLHVVDARLLVAEMAMVSGTEMLLSGWQAAGEKLVAEAVAQARAADVSADGSVRTDAGASVAEVIVREAGLVAADLIVMGTHGRRGLRRLAMGSDAEAVVRESGVPVLLVRAGASKAG